MPRWRGCAAPTSAWTQAIAESGGPWLLGRDITLADVAVMPAIVRMADLGREGDWADLPRVVMVRRSSARSRRSSRPIIREAC